MRGRLIVLWAFLASVTTVRLGSRRPRTRVPAGRPADIWDPDAPGSPIA